MYYRPVTRGELKDKLKEGVACEVVTDVSSMTTIMLTGWLEFDSFTTRMSENEGWTVYEPRTKEL
jgi:hypothetical protein